MIQRGNNRSPVFADEDDYLRYRALLEFERRRTTCSVHAFVLMTNHVHLLVTPWRANALSEMMHLVGFRYVRYFNDRYSRTGTLWEGRFRSTWIDCERYFFTCSRYIELNPVRAGIVRDPREYRWSSFRANAHGAADPLVEPHALYEALGRNPSERTAAYAALFDSMPDECAINQLRSATNSGAGLRAGA